MSYMLATNETYAGGVSAVDAALDAEALFTPKVTGTVLPNGQTDTETFTVYREYADGSQAVLNAGVKAGYHAGSYETLVNTAEAMFPESVTALQTWDHGGILSFRQDLGLTHTFADGDELDQHLLYVGSLNSEFSTKIVGFAHRPFCSNEIPHGNIAVAQKRTTNHDQLLFSKAQVLAESYNRFHLFCSNATLLKSLELTKSFQRALLDELAPLVTDPDASTRAVNAASNRRDGILYHLADEIETFGSNAYSFYNAVQSYEFHDRTKGKQEAIRKMRVVSEPEKAQSLTVRAGELLLAAA